MRWLDGWYTLTGSACRVEPIWPATMNHVRRLLRYGLLFSGFMCIGPSCSHETRDSPERAVRSHVAFNLGVQERDVEAICSCGVVFHISDHCQCHGKVNGLSYPYLCECPLDSTILPWSRPEPCICESSPTLCLKGATCGSTSPVLTRDSAVRHESCPPMPNQDHWAWGARSDSI